MNSQLPHGQGPIDPQSAFMPPPTPDGTPRPVYPNAQAAMSPYGPPPGWGYPPTAQRRSPWRILTTVALLLMLGGSFLVNLLLLAAVGGDGGSTAITHTLQSGDAQQVVAVIEVAGAIDGEMSARFDRLINQVEQDPGVQALVIEVDSPGGTVTASDEIYARLLRYKSDRAAAGKPAGVVVAMRSSATSGGYYIACAGDWIVAEQTTMTGNIGVLMPNYNFSELMEKHGIKETTVVATGADYKNLGSPFAPETEEGKAYYQALVDDAFSRFKQVVTTGRGSKISGQDIFNGKIFTAAQAQKLGLIDQIGYPRDAYTYAATKVATLSNPQVVRYREPSPGLLGLLVGGVSADAGGKPAPSAQSFDLSSLTRPETLDAWRSARLLYR